MGDFTQIEAFWFLFLFYKTVEIEQKSEEVKVFEHERSSEDPTYKIEELQSSKAHGLKHFIKYLEQSKLICNKRKVSNEQTSYFQMCDRLSTILSDDTSNNATQVLLCHMVERKTYCLEQTNAQKETASEIKEENENEDATEDWLTEEPEDDEDWMTLEPEN